MPDARGWCCVRAAPSISTTSRWISPCSRRTLHLLWNPVFGEHYFDQDRMALVCEAIAFAHECNMSSEITSVIAWLRTLHHTFSAAAAWSGQGALHRPGQRPQRVAGRTGPIDAPLRTNPKLSLDSPKPGNPDMQPGDARCGGHPLQTGLPVLVA